MTSKSQKKNSLGRCSTSQEKRTALTAVSPVTSASVRLMPSAARWNSIPSEGTQGTRTMVAKLPAWCAWKNASRLVAKPARAVARAIQRAKKRGMKSSPNAPANVM